MPISIAHTTSNKTHSLITINFPPIAASRYLQLAFSPFTGHSRRLLQVVNPNVTEATTLVSLLQPKPESCTPPSIKEFPSDGLTREQRRHGFLAVHIIIAVYSFFLLAIVCDDFFVPSITKICESKYIYFFF